MGASISTTWLPIPSLSASDKATLEHSTLFQHPFFFSSRAPPLFDSSMVS